MAQLYIGALTVAVLFFLAANCKARCDCRSSSGHKSKSCSESSESSESFKCEDSPSCSGEDDNETSPPIVTATTPSSTIMSTSTTSSFIVSNSSVRIDWNPAAKMAASAFSVGLGAIGIKNWPPVLVGSGFSVVVSCGTSVGTGNPTDLLPSLKIWGASGWNRWIRTKLFDGRINPENGTVRIDFAPLFNSNSKFNPFFVQRSKIIVHKDGGATSSTNWPPEEDRIASSLVVSCGSSVGTGNPTWTKIFGTSILNKWQPIILV